MNKLALKSFGDEMEKIAIGGSFSKYLGKSLKRIGKPLKILAGGLAVGGGIAAGFNDITEGVGTPVSGSIPDELLSYLTSRKEPTKFSPGFVAPTGRLKTLVVLGNAPGGGFQFESSS